MEISMIFIQNGYVYTVTELKYILKVNAIEGCFSWKLQS